jgi:hypothetical protein
VPLSAIEKALCGIDSEVLRVDKSGEDYLFLTLGVTLSRRPKLLFKFVRVFGVDVPIQTLFENPTIVGMESFLVTA